MTEMSWSGGAARCYSRETASGIIPAELVLMNGTGLPTAALARAVHFYSRWMGRPIGVAMKPIFLVPAIVSLAACGGSPLVPMPDAGGSADEAGTLAPDASGDYATAFSPSQVAAALAQCDLPHGAPVAVSNGNDVLAQAAGAWLLCPTESSPVATLLSPGLVLNARGQWHRLVDDGSGGLTAATGVQGQGPWSAFCEASSSITNSDTCIFGELPDVYLRIETLGNDRSPSGCLVAPAAFESSPRRMFIVDQPDLYCSIQSTGTYEFWLVPL